MKFQFPQLLCAALILGSAASSHATLLGVSSTQLGDRASSTIGYATWDWFPVNTGGAGKVVFDAAPRLETTAGAGVGTDVGASDGELFTDVVFSANMNGTRLGSGDRFYSGIGPSTNPYYFEIEGEATDDIQQFSLQLKQTPTSTGVTVGYFDIVFSINGVVSSAVPVMSTVGTSTEGSNAFTIVGYKWNGLNIEDGDIFNFTITGSSNYVALDTASLDAHSVPEPSTWALMLGSFALVVGWSRRKKRLAA